MCKILVISSSAWLIFYCYLYIVFQKGEKTKMIVFISTQDGVEFLYQLLSLLTTVNQSDSDVEDTEEDNEPQTSLDVYRLHGDMSQKVQPL